MIAPAKRGVPVLLHVFAVEIISIHAPMWGRGTIASESERLGLFQFTPPCGGGPALISGIFTTCNISIHAPVWGRGGCGSEYALAASDFNSRPRVGAGDTVGHRHSRDIVISIHAPVWGRAANLHKCKVLFMCKMVETRDRINGKRWIVSKLVQYTSDRFVLLEQKHPGRYCANLPAYFVLPRSAQQLAYRRIGSPVCTRPVRPMVSMRV